MVYCLVGKRDLRDMGGLEKTVVLMYVKNSFPAPFWKTKDKRQRYVNVD